MVAVCLYFQIHQPFRLKRIPAFRDQPSLDFFDQGLNAGIFQRIAEKCYLPANAILQDLVDSYQGSFQVAFSISGTALQQFERYSPQTLESFQSLARSDCVEFIAETSHHSLASLYRLDEFKAQLAIQRDMIKWFFGSEPQILRNTELIYSDEIGQMAGALGYKAVLAEGVDDILSWRSPNYVYSVPGCEVRLLLRNHQLSDDIAFRFSSSDWSGYPVTADKFAEWVHSSPEGSQVINLFMDYETFGEHHWKESGIFDFLRALPGKVLENPSYDFCTPSEVIRRHAAVSPLSFYRITSWADRERDPSAWSGNRMQKTALAAIYHLEDLLKRLGNPTFIEVWRRLQSSDHFYYMSTKLQGDAEVHAHFSPYESAYDAFINFMNVMRKFKQMVDEEIQSLNA